MKISLSKANFRDMDRFEESNYLLTNGLGGYSSLTLAGSCSRNDHALFMASLVAPNNRFNFIRHLDDRITLPSGEAHPLSSQANVNPYDTIDSTLLFDNFTQTHLPEFTYRIRGIEITKTIVMAQGVNRLAIKYQIFNPLKQAFTLNVTPKYHFCAKGQNLSRQQEFTHQEGKISSNGQALIYRHNGADSALDTPRYESGLYFSYDARDGRPATDAQVALHTIAFVGTETHEQFSIVFEAEEDRAVSLEAQTADEMIDAEIKRQQEYIKHANLKSLFGKQLVRASEQFVVDRDSTESKSIIAGYPFFADWGRDTMIALWGCNLSTNQFEDARQIFRTFIRYERRGVLPNLFPEAGVEPMYNTIDASLLFIVSLYEYYQASGDLEFIRDEAYQCMTNIYQHYRNGTDFEIKMLDNGLISGGSGFDQLTWMDIRYEDIVPTPRHGCAVEINALWFNALSILDFFNQKLNKPMPELPALVEQVKTTFNNEFYNDAGYLNDWIKEGEINQQIRPNQAYAVGLPFPILSQERARSVILTIYKELYSPLGLRSLAMNDPEFKVVCTGSHFDRDMAYHQGTVWGFMIGQFLIGILRQFPQDKDLLRIVEQFIEHNQDGLYEGCIGQLAEIYDGYAPSQSRGCFAQAWSVSEVLRVVKHYEETIQK
ncbi:amylo-alpha-1,6-glucosidase [Vibrio splendidus]|uniref:amylo-alpha-1,6-glucosidase n=1 Tax=Vibrio splendidus TaxID=29497 RepID=UPI000C8581DC|nr:amylo-alpha-1,6-glucosidase [Vibrio splendidus]PMH07987.1 amylo-1,6-glucosidase [Vibrio splendidus]PMI82194.1 amylo-1,6-glucosidase [Vibrio splendidus]PMK17896.1 amylo-1,6-glucosidase [Vibrio splendidus]PMK57182.1 amylo-1,6-glucosidase [Vibrio splendidus]